MAWQAEEFKTTIPLKAQQLNHLNDGINELLNKVPIEIAGTVSGGNAAGNKKVWVGTSAQYASAVKNSDTIYFVT